MFCQDENLCFKTGLVSLKILGSLFWPEKTVVKMQKGTNCNNQDITEKSKKEEKVKYDQRKTERKKKKKKERTYTDKRLCTT